MRADYGAPAELDMYTTWPNLCGECALCQERDQSKVVRLPRKTLVDSEGHVEALRMVCRLPDPSRIRRIG
jgi:hypothetical protein